MEAWAEALPPGLVPDPARHLVGLAVLLNAEGEGEVDTELIDPNECLRTMDVDWESDSGGKAALEREDFHRCVFQLCDVQTTGVSAEEYAEWITMTFARIRVKSSVKRSEAKEKAEHQQLLAAAASKKGGGKGGKGGGGKLKGKLLKLGLAHDVLVTGKLLLDFGKATAVGADMSGFLTLFGLETLALAKLALF